MFDSKTTSRVTELFGDPAGLAKYQFRLAQDLCAECRDYHALWPYRRLSGMVFGIETSAEIVVPLLREVTPPNGRILIIGSADAGMMDLTVRATNTLTPSIHVADRCSTPLEVCRRHAKTHGFSITTVPMDFRSSAPPGRYDVVFGHCILQFVPQHLRVDFLSRLNQAMTERGALVLVERLRTGDEDELRQRDYAAETIDALVGQGIELPEEEAAFRLRLDRIVNVRRTRITNCLAPNDLRSSLAEAGFQIREVANHDKQRTVVLPNGESVTLEVALALPKRNGHGR